MTEDGGASETGKVTRRRRRRGVERKRLVAHVSYRSYVNLCDIAGNRSFGSVLDELISNVFAAPKPLNGTKKKNSPKICDSKNVR